MKYLMANYLHYPEEFVQIFLQAFDNILYVSQHRITLVNLRDRLCDILKYVSAQSRGFLISLTLTKYPHF